MKKVTMLLVVSLVVLFFASFGFAKSMGKYGERVAADFGAGGLYEWVDGEWIQISTNSPDDDGGVIGIGDLLYADYGSHPHSWRAGIWEYDPEGGEIIEDRWIRINTGNPEMLGVYDDQLLGDFGSNGLWLYEDGTTWTRISENNAEQIFLTDPTTLWVDFGEDGLWEYDGIDWTELSSANLEGVADFFKK